MSNRNINIISLLSINFACVLLPDWTHILYIINSLHPYLLAIAYRIWVNLVFGNFHTPMSWQIFFSFHIPFYKIGSPNQHQHIALQFNTHNTILVKIFRVAVNSLFTTRVLFMSNFKQESYCSSSRTLCCRMITQSLHWDTNIIARFMDVPWKRPASKSLLCHFQIFWHVIIYNKFVYELISIRNYGSTGLVIDLINISLFVSLDALSGKYTFNCSYPRTVFYYFLIFDNSKIAETPDIHCVVNKTLKFIRCKKAQ